MQRFHVMRVACFALIVVCSGGGIVELGRSVMADEPQGVAPNDPLQSIRWALPEIKIPIKTMGGRQFWGDRAFFRGWRIQHNTLTNHHRLLDQDDYRYASGTLAECMEELEAIKEKEELEPMQGRAVVFLHGITRSSKSFSAMMDAFAKEPNTTVVPFDYPSTQVSLKLSAEYLDDVLKSLQGIDEIHLICHSMGGLVVRKYLEEHQDPRLKRMIMIGTPNSGSEVANLLQQNFVYKAVMGPAGQDLIVKKGGAIDSLPIPEFEFAIVAGARGNNEGFNPLLPGDDDGTVTLASAKLTGATDFMTAPYLHSFIMQNKQVIENCLRFINTGAFRESGEREPVTE